MGAIISLKKQPFGFLSNFYKCNITIGKPMDLTFDSAEAAYQAIKSENPADWELIQSATSPGTAKVLGKKITIRKDWEQIKKEAMAFVLRIKFQNEGLKRLLVGTYPHTIVEGNSWHDNYWGVCSCYSCPGIGENTLGTLLMLIRTECVINEEK